MCTSRNRLLASIAALALIGMWHVSPVPAFAAEMRPGFTPQMDVEDPDDGALNGGEPEDPDMSRKDGTGAPPLATPNKEDREDLLGDEESPTDPTIRAVTRDGLYDELHRAKSATAAEPITAAIEQAWRNSGSDTVDLLMTHVDTFILAADLDLAMQVLDAVTDMAPDDAEAWHQRGLIYSMKGDNQRALSDLKHALEADPRHYKALLDLGALLRQTGDKKGALDAYRKALEINPYLDQARPAEEELTHEVEGQDI